MTDNSRALDRYLSPLDVWGLALGCMVGWGVFAMPGNTFLPVAGPAGTAIAMVVGMVIMLVIGSNFSYLMGRSAITGGMYSYTGDKLLNVTYDTAGRINTIEATRDSIVKILSKAGTILEVYCYYRALETGYFDDIACSCTFYWGDQELVDSQRKNEIDLILTKGFQTIIAECKATVDLTQDYFHKLNTISDLFGINARKILIANTYSSNQDRGRRNQEQISRGELMDILTIYKKEEIAKIGTKLASLMRRY